MDLNTPKDKLLLFLSNLHTAAVETQALPWVASILFSAGSFSDLFLDSSYITNHSILATGSVLWMLYAFTKKAYPTLFQHVIMFAISMYALTRKLNVGKFAYLTAALLCTSCSVYRHENVMNAKLGICSNVSNTHSASMTSMPWNPRPPVCKLETVNVALDEKIKIVNELRDILAGLKGGRDHKGPFDSHEYYPMYISAAAQIDGILRSLEKKNEYCSTKQ